MLFSIYLVPSVLWCCWLGGKKGIGPIKACEVLAWLSVWSEVPPHHLFAPVKSWMVYLSGAGLQTDVVVVVVVVVVAAAAAAAA